MVRQPSRQGHCQKRPGRIDSAARLIGFEASGDRGCSPDLEMPDAMSLLDLTLETVEANLALDEALLIEADEGRAGAVLRFWDYPRFAVVLGASRRLAGDVRVDAC